MNRSMFIGSLAGMVLFALLLLLTVFGQQSIKDFARDYLNRRIEPGVTKGVAVIEREVLPKLTQPEVVLPITTEINAYRADPLRYIDQVTSGRVAPPAEGWKAKASEALQSSAKKTVTVRQMIGDHFRQVFEHLVLDLRIFAISNIIGFAVVAWLTKDLSGPSRRLQIQAFILCLATGYALSAYIKQDWFFNLLLDFHMGMMYPLLIVLTCVDLWRRWRRGQFRTAAKDLVEEMVLG